MTMFSSVFSRLIANCKVEVTLLLMLSLIDSDSSCSGRDRTASTLDTIASVGICLGVTESLSPLTTAPPLFSL